METLAGAKRFVAHLVARLGSHSIGDICPPASTSVCQRLPASASQHRGLFGGFEGGTRCTHCQACIRCGINKRPHLPKLVRWSFLTDLTLSASWLEIIPKLAVTAVTAVFLQTTPQSRIRRQVLNSTLKSALAVIRPHYRLIDAESPCINEVHLQCLAHPMRPPFTAESGAELANTKHMLRDTGALRHQTVARSPEHGGFLLSRPSMPSLPKHTPRSERSQISKRKSAGVLESKTLFLRHAPARLPNIGSIALLAFDNADPKPSFCLSVPAATKAHEAINKAPPDAALYSAVDGYMMAAVGNILTDMTLCMISWIWMGLERNAWQQSLFQRLWADRRQTDRDRHTRQLPR
ncbi:hypothetical protein B0T25DRAFT_215832 [Lasiosphaeria hispida]|uniref:Uncharacterized protein n=1 Tax=Lasiosphaeria hispida TaxID=260671 RepID=A0AAJ0MEV5_9PEZI|nr:hypothetical protein B0T25DRAFT_215832 [Lasiosphaeria hispida]